MANMMLTHFWLKFTDMLLFTVCVFISLQIFNIEVFETGKSYSKDTCFIIFFTFVYIFM